MTDLEFIERLIEDKKLLCKNELFYREEHHKGLQHLQQIKAKLEAWEVVKRELKLTVKVDELKYAFVYYWLIYHPYDLLEIEKQDYEIIKKALEVSDEIQSDV